MGMNRFITYFCPNIMLMNKQKFYVNVINLLHEAEQNAGIGESARSSKNAPNAKVITFRKRPAP